MSNYINILALLSILTVSITCISQAQKNPPIPINPNNRVDTTLVRRIDVTGDGKPERIELSISAPSFRSPFIWTMCVISKSDTLYSYHVSDAEEIMFGDPPVSDSSYLSLKYDYYFKQFVDLSVNCSVKVGKRDSSESFYQTVYNVTKEQLERGKGISSSRASKIAKEMAERIRKKEIPILEHWDGSVDITAVAYCKELNCFIMVLSA